MQLLQASILAVAIYFGIRWLLKLRFPASKPGLIPLAFCIGIATVSYVGEWLMLHPDTPFKAAWLCVVMACPLLFVGAIFKAATKLDLIDAEHAGNLYRLTWYLIVVALICLLPLLSSVHAGNTFLGNSGPASVERAFFIHSTMYLSCAIFSCLAPCVAWRLFNSDKPSTMRDFLVLALTAKWLASLLRFLHCAIFGANPGWELNAIITVDIAVTMWSLSEVLRLAFENRSKTSKYRASGLTDNMCKSLSNKLETAMRQKCMYRKASLKLDDLAQAIGERPHYVSQVINQIFGCNYYDWLNRHRIKEAAHLLSTEPDMSVLDISLAVGYNSKSTFNAAFRKVLGITPSHFRHLDSSERYQLMYDPIRSDASVV